MGLPIISTVTTPTSCLKKIYKTNQILIIKIIVTKHSNLNEPLRLKREREKKVTKAPKDVRKEEEYLGKEWCPTVVGTVKDG